MFAASGASWFPITDALPQCERFPPGFEDGESVDHPPLPPPPPGVIRGRCLCGDVAFELTGEPEILQNCHCSRCRRARSAAHATNAFFKREQLAWIRGEENVTSFALPGAKRFGQDVLPPLRRPRRARRRLDGLRRRALRQPRRSARQVAARPHLHGQQGAVVRDHRRAPAMGGAACVGSLAPRSSRSPVAVPRARRKRRSARWWTKPSPRPRRATPRHCATSSPTTTAMRPAATPPTSATSCTPGWSRTRRSTC